MKTIQAVRYPARSDYQTAPLLDSGNHSGDAHQTPGKAAAPRAEVKEIWAEQFAQDEIAPRTPHQILSTPEVDHSFWVDIPVMKFLWAIQGRSQRGEVVNVLLTGPTGTGKSSLPSQFAAIWHHPFFAMHCQLITEQEDWWGTRELSPERGTYFQKMALVDAIETPGCIILLDEANRTNPENLNALFGFLDHRRKAWVPALHREVKVAPGVVFFITVNEGVDYVGVNAIDRALKDRISNTIRMDYPPTNVEMEILGKRTGIDNMEATKLVEFADTVRRNPKLDAAISTRQLLECAALINDGLSLHDAMMFAIINSAGQDMERKALLQAFQMNGEVSEVYSRFRVDDEDD